VTARLPAETEAEFMAKVIDWAKLRGWKVYHPRLSKWSERGWPDLAMVRAPRLVLAELKSEKGTVTGPQQVWLDELGRCPAVEVHLWRPSDFDQMIETLR
jgi:hypothetical protein